jgi:hypothetical protein
MKILARKLNEFSVEQLWENLVGSFTLVFDDGEMEVSAKETIYSHYVWEFHRKYPNAPLLKSHHVRSTIKTGRLGANTHIKLIGTVLWDIFDNYTQLEKVQFVDDLAKLAYRVTNKLYNELTYRLEDSVVSLDIVDFIQILENPKVKNVLDNMQPTSDDINKAYAALDYALLKDEDLKQNPLAKGAKSRLIKQAQILQCLGPRGMVTDIDSNYFPEPIMRGYVRGFRSIYDSMIESRSAAKALYFSKKDLQDAEYFSRKLQLLCQTVKNLHHTDCGSTNYLNWHVRPAVYQDGEKISSSDIDYLLGKYFLDPDTNKLRPIRPSDTYLEGKTIKVRSVIAGCNHPDHYGICSVCFGELANVVPANTNIGQLCSTTLTQKSSQSILSTKHLDSNSSAEAIVILQEDKRFIKVSSSGSEYLLSDHLKGKGVKLIISSAEASSLTDVANVTDVHKLAMTRVSEITTVGFMVENKGLQITPIELNRGKRYASLTYAALDFIKRKGWSVDEKENFIIDLDGWNFNDPVFSLPARHFNMSDVTQTIAAMLESNMEDVRNSSDVKAPEAIVVELYDLVNKYLSVNLAVLEVTLLGALVRSNDSGDYRIPKGFTNREMGASKRTIPSRSLGGAMAYEYHYNTLIDPRSHIKANRSEHPFDVMLLPQEVLDSRRK